MNSLNHIIGGVAISAVAGAIADANLYESPALVVTAICAALLPDIDKPGAMAFYACPPLGNFIHRRFGHRTITHGLPVAILLSVVVAQCTPGNFGFFFASGYFSHILLDLLTISGVPLLYPFSDKIAVLPELAVSSKNPAAQWLYTALFSAVVVGSYSMAQNGFWQSYNQSFSTPRHVASEMRKTPNAVRVVWSVRRGSDTISGNSYAVEADDGKLVLWDDSTSFHRFAAPDYVFLKAEPHRTGTRQVRSDFHFAGISNDSLQALIDSEVILKIDISANCDFEAFAIGFPAKTGKSFSGECLEMLRISPVSKTVQRAPVSQIPSERVAALRARADRLKAEWDGKNGDFRNDRAQSAALLIEAADEPDEYQKTKLIEKSRDLDKTKPPADIADQLAEIRDEIYQSELAAAHDYQRRKEQSEADFIGKLPEKPRFSGFVQTIQFLEPETRIGLK